MCVYILHIELNQNAAQDMFCTDQAGPGRLPFTKDTARQECTGAKTAWLAALGSPQEVNNCL